MAKPVFERIYRGNGDGNGAVMVPIGEHERRRGSLIVGPNSWCYLDLDRRDTRHQAAIASDLSGSLAVAAVCVRENEGGRPDDLSVVMARHRPTGDRARAAHFMTAALSSELDHGYHLQRAVILAPGGLGRVEGEAYFRLHPAADAVPDVVGYHDALGEYGDGRIEVASYIPERRPSGQPAVISESLLAEIRQDGGDAAVGIYTEGVLRPEPTP